ncbi:MAG: carboxypeptidase-like regulatory domain-containing protein, partial [Terasakiella sp.]|nr:carboxypeptidase-like regulatory domain-containing protein [Terasakiella sp.]
MIRKLFLPLALLLSTAASADTHALRPAAVKPAAATAISATPPAATHQLLGTGPRHSAPQKAAAGRVIFTEDFSRMTAGSEATPDPAAIVGDIPETLTAKPGWQGASIHQAGGCVYIDSYQLTQGGQTMTVHYIDTPLLGLGASTPNITVRLRARSANAAGDTFYVLNALSDGSQVSTVSHEQLAITGQWAEYSVILTGCSAGTYLELQSDSHPVYIDDIVVEEIPALATPKVRPATDITADGYTARWDAVADATGYMLTPSIIRTSTGLDPYYIIDTDFSGITEGTTDAPVSKYVYSLLDSYITEKGWLAYFPTWAGGALGLTNRYLQTHGNAYLQSPTLDLSAADGSINIEMRYRASGVDMFQISMYSVLESGKMSLRSTRMIYPGDKTGWIDLNTTLGGGTARSIVVIVLPETTSGDIIIDDLHMWQQLPEGTRYTVPMSRITTEADHQRVSTAGCKPDDSFSYSVMAYRQLTPSTMIYSQESNTIVVGNDSDEVPDRLGTATVRSTTVDGGEFTATWDPVPGANAYEIAVYREHYSDGRESATMLMEDFNAIKVGTDDLDRPKAMSEDGYDRLDAFTSVPGWEVFQGFYVDGAVGILGYWNMMGVGCYMRSPVLDLSADGGAMQLSLKVGSDYYEQGATVYLAHDHPETGATIYDDILPLDAMSKGMHNFAQSFKGGRKDSYLVFFPYGYGLSYFDDIKITQRLPEGNSSTRVTGRITGGTSVSLTVPAVDTSDKYYYTVRALWVDAYDKEKVSGAASARTYIDGLAPTTWCTGTVKDGDGAGIAGASVVLYPAGAPSQRLTATTNRWGIFRIANISDYSSGYILQASAPGYYTGTVQGITFEGGAPAEDTEVVLRASSGANDVEIGLPTASSAAGPAYLQYTNSDSETVYPAEAIAIPAGAKILSVAYDGYCPTQKDATYKMTLYMENLAPDTPVYTEGAVGRDVAAMTAVASASVKIDAAGSKTAPAEMLRFDLGEGYVYDGGDLRVSMQSRSSRFNDIYFLVDATRPASSIYRYFSSTPTDNWRLNKAGMPVMRVTYSAPDGIGTAIIGADDALTARG